MRKIASAFIFAILAWFSGGVWATTCDPNSPAVPCDYDGKTFDTVMYNNNMKAFYNAEYYFVDHTINQDPDVNDISNIWAPPCSQGVVWIYGTPYGFCGASVNSAAAGYGWIGRGANVWHYFTFPRLGYTAYTNTLNSFTDNDVLGTATPYAMNGTISIFNGESGTAAAGCNCASTGLSCNSSNYSSCGIPGYLKPGGGGWTFASTVTHSGSYAYYDGHPGYDYSPNQDSVAAIHAPAGGTLCVAHSLTTQQTPSAEWRNTAHCDLGAAPGTSGFTYPVNWQYYHTFYILHGPMLVNGSTDEYMTVFLHNHHLHSDVLSGIYQDGYKMVNRNQEVADAGGWGPSGANSFSPHVHIEFYRRADQNSTWQRVDPYGDGTNNILWLKKP